MTLYEDALKALCSLLDKTGERFWRDWISEDLRLWESSKSVDHHLSAYGGMGSLNDLVICKKNEHNVSSLQEPWVNALFSDLRSVCYDSAHHTRGPNSTVGGLENAMGTLRSVLEGWRCSNCDYTEVSLTGIENYVAYHLIRRNILQAVKQLSLQKFVDEVIDLEIDEAEAERSRVRKAVMGSGIEIVERDDWMGPCPACGSNKTAVSRWKESGLLTKRFEPTF